MQAVSLGIRNDVNRGSARTVSRIDLTGKEGRGSLLVVRPLRANIYHFAPVVGNPRAIYTQNTIGLKISVCLEAIPPTETRVCLLGENIRGTRGPQRNERRQD